MSKQDFMDKMIALDTTFELAIKHNDETAATEISKEIETLMSSAMDEFSETEMFEMALILDNVL